MTPISIKALLRTPRRRRMVIQEKALTSTDIQNGTRTRKSEMRRQPADMWMMANATM